MELWKSVILGAVQGLTEFLPVSSSGHLVVWSRILGVTSSVAFDVALHVGSLIALLVVFWRDIVGLVRGFAVTFASQPTREDRHKRTMFWLIVLAIAPSGVAGVLLGSRIEQAFGSLLVVAAMFVVTAVLLFLQRFCSTSRTVRDINWLDAVVVGIGQCFALLPGLSRSGTTMSFGVYRGLKQEDAAHFSFLMAIPTIAGAAVFKVRDFISLGLSGVALRDLGVGIVVSVVVSLLAIGLLLRVARRGRMQWFAVYCLLMAVVTFVLHVKGGI
jgi:undecaprenyl-diphosphatase